ncbi:ComEC/Rec2 family competence protein [Nocardioides ferulae]|uniref:ComEC/Rec2 family competence protein n=1 Tax=Nocardioides ferulae TaxID=2340821 RepID=UPI001F0B87B8|nr:ComEC/Rec2 family competence protein [Nocardioides ferulae]
MRVPAETGSAIAEPGEPGPDLRMPLLGAVAWAGALVAWLLPTWVAAAVVATLTPVAAVGLRRAPRARGGGRPWRSTGTATALGALLVLAAAVSVTLVRQHQVAGNPVAALAEQRAVVTVEATVTSDPRPLVGGFAERVLLRAEVRRVHGRGAAYALATPVLVIADPAWSDVALGSTVQASGRLDEADDGDLAAVLVAQGEPTVRAPPDVWWRAAGAVRGSLREAVAHRPAEQRALVPALVVGDDAAVGPDLAEDFRTTGLTHLLAVSGTNLTLLVGSLLVVGRWCGVRGRWTYLVGALGITGFVLLARTEPSVLRAAVMGAVALVGLGVNGRDRGLRTLGVAVVVLLLADPSLSVSPGFALSVLATAGILVLGPPWRDALARWLPRWAAEAIAVPAAAQLACTPVVAALSGEVSLVAVASNLLAAPAVGPATVLGLLAGLLGLVSDPVAQVVGTGAGWCVGWIVLVARWGADLPTAAIDWGTGPVALAALTALTVVIGVGGPWLLGRRSVGVACCLVAAAVVGLRPPSPGWPAAAWVVAMCDVGQGDALVLNAGHGAGVVVDAGPDPAAVDECLDRLDVARVPLLVLTHFHADHVDGLPGVLEGREVVAIETTSRLDPAGGVHETLDTALEAGLGPTIAPYGQTRTVGDVSLQVLWPTSPEPVAGPGDGSRANDDSVVLLAEVRGVRVLLTGDVEPPAQARLAAAYPDLAVDVLKLPHHGSSHQDLDWLASLSAAAVLVSVGADNDYGHPSGTVLDALESAGAAVHRTDLDGDVVVSGVPGQLEVHH